MNTSPSPTPYDIVEIPSFPFIPSIILWLGLASIGLVSYFIFRLISIKSAQKKNRETLHSAKRVGEIHAHPSESRGGISNLNNDKKVSSFREWSVWVQLDGSAKLL